MHSGWEPSNVATAKCDMCSRQRCGVIQKCSDCKLSVCRDCAYADRLANDVRHELDPATAEWDSRTIPRGRGSRSSRRVSKAREDNVPRGSGHGRGQGEAATSFTPVRNPQAHLGSSAGQNTRLQGQEHKPASIQVNSNPHSQSMQRTRSTVGNAKTSVTQQQAQDAAQILVAMPNNRQDDRHESFQKRNKYDNVPRDSTLPPLRSIPDHNGCSLPPLNTMYPDMSYNDGAATHQQNASTLPASTPFQVAPTALMSPEPAQEDSVHLHAQYGYGDAHHHQAPHAYQSDYANAYHGGGGSTTSSYLIPSASTTQNASNQQQYMTSGTQYSNASYDYSLSAHNAPDQQYYAAAQTQYGHASYGPQGQYGEQAYAASPQAQTFPGQQYAIGQNQYGSATYASFPPMQETYGYGSFSQPQPAAMPPMNQLAPMEPSSVATAASGTHAPATTLPMAQTAAAQPCNPQTSSIPSVQAQLVRLARAVKHSEHADWPMEFCLRLAAQRSWSATMPTVRGTPQVFMALAQLMAATDRAILELNLPETNNSARLWLREEQSRISAPTANPSNRLSLANYLSNPPRGNSA
ncbi:hypothetical protein JDV02_001769 [Purpureocillium takamizusanense]|uniref:Uncharacterized protein n=1 Tax=Purpureocillium takamizusanense TaxID=2060973 RepID=A0A9Q8V7V7_9HYPO|nr:uncharacterized protein JDV02_001769 [Purpureocillium takamizusanense]UNI15214.1 hypothetical protein JDV02_001769 [Purpureocillium takamizusanense]